jgi:hypothetical protein
MSKFTDIRDGLVTVVETVTAIEKVYPFEPASIGVKILAWVLLDSYSRSTASQIVPMRYRFRVTVAAPIQNTKEAEDAVIDAAMLVADAVDKDPQFSGKLVSGLAQSPDGQATWIMLGGVKCRVVDVFVDALNKTAYGA